MASGKQLQTVSASLKSPVPLKDVSWLTQVKAVQLRYTWTIPNFSFLRNTIDECLKSPTFSADDNHKLKWCLEVYYRYSGDRYYLSFRINLLPCDILQRRASFKYSFLDDSGDQHNLKQFEACFDRSVSWCTEKFICRDELFKYSYLLFPENKLTIFFELSIIENDQSNIVQFKVPKCKLLDDFWNLFDNKKFSDVTLTIEGKEIQAHKAILAARSPVFAAMFEHNMKESKLNLVSITDVAYEVLIEILRFMYTGKISHLEKMAYDLLAAADKYSLEKLKVMCEEALCNNLSVEKAAGILILADLHSADRLKSETINFINKRSKDVLETDGWKNMIESHPHFGSYIK